MAYAIVRYPARGHAYAFQALANVKKSFNNFELHIIGDGALKGDLELLSNELGIQENTFFHGTINHRELPRLLANYHISLTPSARTDSGYDESFCISLIEASVMGLYCMASDAGGPSEILQDKQELMYPQKDVNALTIKI